MRQRTWMMGAASVVLVLATSAAWAAPGGGGNVYEAFRRLDRNGDGVVDLSEAIRANVVTKPGTYEGFAKHDTDGNGAIDMGEAMKTGLIPAPRTLMKARAPEGEVTGRKSAARSDRTRRDRRRRGADAPRTKGRRDAPKAAAPKTKTDPVKQNRRSGTHARREAVRRRVHEWLQSARRVHEKVRAMSDDQRHNLRERFRTAKPDERQAMWRRLAAPKSTDAAKDGRPCRFAQCTDRTRGRAAAGTCPHCGRALAAPSSQQAHGRMGRGRMGSWQQRGRSPMGAGRQGFWHQGRTPMGAQQHGRGRMGSWQQRGRSPMGAGRQGFWQQGWTPMGTQQRGHNQVGGARPQGAQQGTRGRTAWTQGRGRMGPWQHGPQRRVGKSAKTPAGTAPQAGPARQGRMSFRGLSQDQRAGLFRKLAAMEPEKRRETMKKLHEAGPDERARMLKDLIGQESPQPKAAPKTHVQRRGGWRGRGRGGR